MSKIFDIDFRTGGMRDKVSGNLLTNCTNAAIDFNIGNRIANIKHTKGVVI